MPPTMQQGQIASPGDEDADTDEGEAAAAATPEDKRWKVVREFWSEVEMQFKEREDKALTAAELEAERKLLFTVRRRMLKHDAPAEVLVDINSSSLVEVLRGALPRDHDAVNDEKPQINARDLYRYRDGALYEDPRS